MDCFRCCTAGRCLPQGRSQPRDASQRSSPARRRSKAAPAAASPSAPASALAPASAAAPTVRGRQHGQPACRAPLVALPSDAGSQLAWEAAPSQRRAPIDAFANCKFAKNCKGRRLPQHTTICWLPQNFDSSLACLQCQGTAPVQCPGPRGIKFRTPSPSLGMSARHLYCAAALSEHSV